MVSCGAFDEEAEIDHDKKLSAFLDRAQERNIGLNAKNSRVLVICSDAKDSLWTRRR